MTICDLLISCWALVSHDPGSCTKLGDTVDCDHKIEAEFKTAAECNTAREKSRDNRRVFSCMPVSKD